MARNKELWTGIRRLQGLIVRVQVKGGKHLLNEPGVTCVNPDDPEPKRVYRKDFTQRRLYLPNQYDEAIAKEIGKDAFVVSMNGYSSITAAWRAKYKIKEGAYEAACAAILTKMVKAVVAKFAPALTVKIIDGASHMGIDGVIQNVAKSFNLPTLGFSCPEFMMYVLDIPGAVYVAADKAAYADLFVKSLDLLITTGGRIHAFEHDSLAAIKHRKRVHFVDVPNMVAELPVPATITDANGEIVIENVAAGFGLNISYENRGSFLKGPALGDQWENLFSHIESIAVGIARDRLPAEHMFQDV